MYIYYVLSFILPLVIMIFATPKLTKLAYKINYIEKVKLDSERKIHTDPKPYLASVGMFIAFWISYIIFVPHINTRTILIFISSLLIYIIGTIDDWFKIKEKDFHFLPKMIVQLIACILIYVSGIKFNGITNPFNDQYILFPDWIQFFLTIIWMFGIITVINFSDGMDGLAGGITFISAGTLFIVSAATGNYNSSIMSVILMGICLGYLKYNKFPAKILMGDSGATFLGFVLGLISLEGAFKQSTIISILVTFIALGLPIFDNIFVIFKRVKNKQPIYIGDSSQIHFRLLSTGLNQKQTVFVLYLICLCLNLIAVIILLLSFIFLK